MYIPQNCLIPDEKLTRYLLVLKIRNDKSQFLAQAGFTQANPEQLKEALLSLIQNYPATFDRSDQYGDFYQVIGTLKGVNLINLEVITVWIQRKADARFQFITLLPQKEKPNGTRTL
jgi:biopolymer transport protein ExbD